MSSKYPRGSEWRKWDLHVHTPASALKHSFGDNWDIYIEKLIDAAKDHDISVIVTADYFTVEGYKKILTYYDKKNRILKINKKEKEIFIIPGIELRLDNFNSEEDSINLHVLFDPEKCSTDFINSNFLERLSVSYRGNSYPLNKQNILAIGKSIIESSPINTGEDFTRFSESKEKKYLSKALSVISLDKKDINEALKKVKKILGKEKIYERPYLIAVAGKGKGALKSLKWFEEHKNFSRAGLIREDITNQADLIFSNDNDDRKFYLGEKPDTPKHEVELRFESLKPCVWGSDSHDLKNLLHPSSGGSLDYTWIKADPTFQGLKSIMREPGSRVFIDENAEEVIKREQERHRFIEKIIIKKTKDSDTRDIWFDNEIKFNGNLVSIIGNRGMGKSALAEIIGLLGSTKNFKHFSYLHKDKFRKDNLAKNFKASIEWKDGTISGINLSEDPNPTDVERVKCIPQNYFETLCNNLDFRFQQEIDKAIFSHIEESDRLDKTNFEDLISCKTENIDSQVKSLQVKVEKLNKKLIDLEKKTEDEYKEELKKRLKLKEKEYKTHFESKPKKVPKPSKEKADSELSKLDKKIEDIEIAIKESKDNLKIYNDKLHKIKNIKDKIKIFSDQYEDLKSELSPILQEIFDIDPQSANKMLSGLLKFKYDLRSINDFEENIKEKKEEVLTKLKKDDLSKEEKKESLYYKLNREKEKADLLQSKLDEPAKKYQAFLKKHKIWSKKHEEIKKDLDIIGKDSEYIKISLEEDIKKAEKDRKKLTKQIFDLLEEKKYIYKELYKPVINFIEEEKKRRNKMEGDVKNNKKQDEFLNFTVESSLSSRFFNEFLSFIDRGRKGSFQGVTESQKELEEVINKYNFSEISEPLDFLEEILVKLKSYEGRKFKIEDQLVKDRTKLELYNFLFCLNFIEINFSLKWGNKSLQELSPGERGMLLLIFYLLIDNNDWPLIIDQPEENLDNESVFLTLVPYIKKAKVSRQLILVTHNPNIAVVCDAEQIIIAEIQKQNKNKVFYTSGSIENPEINKKLLNILEGTKPAFENRGSKYLDLSF